MSDARTPGAGTGNLSTRQKITVIIVSLLAVTVVVVGIGVVHMQGVGEDLSRIVEKDVPLIQVLSDVSEHQLGQAINLERALRFGKNLERDVGQRASFTEAAEAFDALAREVDDGLATCKRMVELAITGARTSEQRAELEQILAAIEKIETKHANYDESAKRILLLLSRGEFDKVTELDNTVKLETEIDHETVALLSQVEAFAGNAALTAGVGESTAIGMTAIITAIALIGGLILVTLVMRVLGVAQWGVLPMGFRKTRRQPATLSSN